jgi:preprotein translocase subunit SecE
MSTSQVQTVGVGLERAKLSVAAALLIGALAAFYLLSKQGPLVQWFGLLLGLGLAAGVFFVSETGRELIGFGRDAWYEVRKVVWPARKEAIQVTAYVFGFVLIMALFLWLTDKTLEWLFYDLILGWRK